MKSSRELLKREDNPVGLERMLPATRDNICDWHEHNSKSLLMLAAQFGREKCCALLLEKYPESIHDRNSRNCTALHFACFHGHRNICMMLLDAGSNPYEVNQYGESCFESATSGGHLVLSDEVKLETLKCSSLHLSQATTVSQSRCGNINHARRKHFVTWSDLRPRVVSDSESYDYISSGALGNLSELTSRKSEESWYLEIVSCSPGSDQSLLGKRYHISGSQSTDIYLGRSSSNVVCITDLSISKQHAVLSRHGSLFFVQDLNSVHGTFINGIKLHSKSGFTTRLGIKHNEGIVLKENDTLMVGRICLSLKRQLAPAVVSGR